MSNNSSPRQEYEFTLVSTDQGKVTVTMVDRINVDDVFLQLVHGEVYRLITGEDPGADVNELFKGFLLKERFTAG